MEYRNLPEPAALRAVNLRLRDQKGEMFQWKRRPGEKNGALSFDVSADNFSDCWGGNGRPELPLEVAGLGFDFAAGSGVGAIEPGRLTFEAGRHLRFPAREVWRSFGEDELWQLQAYRGRVHAVEEADSLTVDAAAEIVIFAIGDCSLRHSAVPARCGSGSGWIRGRRSSPRSCAIRPEKSGCCRNSG